jgi:hypothetical protein
LEVRTILTETDAVEGLGFRGKGKRKAFKTNFFIFTHTGVGEETF